MSTFSAGFKVQRRFPGILIRQRGRSFYRILLPPLRSLKCDQRTGSAPFPLVDSRARFTLAVLLIVTSADRDYLSLRVSVPAAATNLLPV